VAKTFGGLAFLCTSGLVGLFGCVSWCFLRIVDHTRRCGLKLRQRSPFQVRGPVGVRHSMEAVPRVVTVIAAARHEPPRLFTALGGQHGFGVVAAIRLHLPMHYSDTLQLVIQASMSLSAK